MDTQSERAQRVLELAGETLAHEAGIRLADEPAPLWRLLVLTNLVSARISADIALAAARELFAAGGDTPQGMAELTWRQRVDALGRGHYVRYDESTASGLGECARHAIDVYGGDMRRLASVAEHDPRRLERELRRFHGIGPTGAAIFCREVQEVWEWLRPYADGTTRKGAAKAGLPTDPEKLAELVTGADLARFFAGLTRVRRDGGLARRLLSPQEAR